MLRTATPVELSSDVLARLKSCWRIKLFLLVGLTVAFCGPYFFLAHHAFFPIRNLPTTWLDRATGFDPRWVWVYQSIYLLTATLPWLANERRQLFNFVRGFVMLATICFAVYLCFPTMAPRPAVTKAGGMYAFLLCYDGPLNACPSLHAGFLYYTLAFTYRVMPRVRWTVAGSLFLWSGLILWATLATKEHYAVDLVAGIGLAVACDVAAWSRIFRRKGAKSQAGLR